MAAHGAQMNMTYGVSKSGINPLVKSMAIHNAGYGIRINVIVPGLMDTPMAIERRARKQNRSRDEIPQVTAAPSVTPGCYAVDGGFSRIIFGCLAAIRTFAPGHFVHFPTSIGRMQSAPGRKHMNVGAMARFF